MKLKKLAAKISSLVLTALCCSCIKAFADDYLYGTSLKGTVETDDKGAKISISEVDKKLVKSKCGTENCFDDRWKTFVRKELSRIRKRCGHHIYQITFEGIVYQIVPDTKTLSIIGDPRCNNMANLYALAALSSIPVVKSSAPPIETIDVVCISGEIRSIKTCPGIGLICPKLLDLRGSMIQEVNNNVFSHTRIVGIIPGGCALRLPSNLSGKLTSGDSCLASASDSAQPSASGPAQPSASGLAQPSASGPAQPSASGPAQPSASAPILGTCLIGSIENRGTEINIDRVDESKLKRALSKYDAINRAMSEIRKRFPAICKVTYDGIVYAINPTEKTLYINGLDSSNGKISESVINNLLKIMYEPNTTKKSIYDKFRNQWKNIHVGGKPSEPSFEVTKVVMTGKISYIPSGLFCTSWMYNDNNGVQFSAVKLPGSLFVGIPVEIFDLSGIKSKELDIGSRALGSCYTAKKIILPGCPVTVHDAVLHENAEIINEKSITRGGATRDSGSLPQVSPVRSLFPSVSGGCCIVA